MKNTLLKNEVWLLADLLNSQYWNPEDKFSVEMMIGTEEGTEAASPICEDTNGRPHVQGCVANGLEHEILDGMRLLDLDQMWGIDGVALLMKIRAMTPKERFQLIDTIKFAWKHASDEKFDEVLESLAQPV